MSSRIKRFSSYIRAPNLESELRRYLAHLDENIADLSTEVRELSDQGLLNTFVCGSASGDLDGKRHVRRVLSKILNGAALGDDDFEG